MAHIGIGSNRITHWSFFQSISKSWNLNSHCPVCGDSKVGRDSQAHVRQLLAKWSLPQRSRPAIASISWCGDHHSVCDVCDHDRLPGQASYSWIGWDTSLARPSPRASNASTRTSTSSSSGGPGSPGDQQHVAHCRPPLIHWHGSSMAAQVDGLLVCDHVKRNLGR